MKMHNECTHHVHWDENNQIMCQTRALDLSAILSNIVNPLTSRPECMPGSSYTGVGVLFFVI